MGSIEEKVRAIEHVDEMLGVLIDGFDGVVSPSCPTTRPRSGSGHTLVEAVPVAVRGLGTDDTRRYSEKEAEKGDLGGSRRQRSLPAPARAVVSRHQPPCVITFQWG